MGHAYDDLEARADLAVMEVKSIFQIPLSVPRGSEDSRCEFCAPTVST